MCGQPREFQEVDQREEVIDRLKIEHNGILSVSQEIGSVPIIRILGPKLKT